MQSVSTAWNRVATIGWPARFPPAPTILRWAWVPLAVLLIIAFAYAASRQTGGTQAPSATPQRPAVSPGRLAGGESFAPLTDPQDLMPIAPEDALALNAARPALGATGQAAAPLLVKASLGGVRDTALQCLTSALYYEAASESDDGQRAVAQVILNRARHPAYPSSICGVVYQGSTRVTGCQFTFTCDGSLARTPSAAGWARSRRIAEAALSGQVFAPVGYSTHYHADYVVPYWAASLAKVQTIGRHIFYRWSGRAGLRGAFRQHYAGVEQIPGPVTPTAVAVVEAVPPTNVVAETSTLVADAAPVLKPAAPSSNLKVDRTPRRPLLADVEAGKLVATAGRATPRAANRPLALSELSCARAQPAAPIRPINGDVSGARQPADGCS